jgi:hypothetical protein
MFVAVGAVLLVARGWGRESQSGVAMGMERLLHGLQRKLLAFKPLIPLILDGEEGRKLVCIRVVSQVDSHLLTVCVHSSL